MTYGTTSIGSSSYGSGIDAPIVIPDMWYPETQQPYKEKIEVINYN